MSTPSIRPSLFRLFLPFVVWLLLAGCATSEYTYTTKIADGQRLTFRMIKGQVLPAQGDGFDTGLPQIVPEAKNKTLQYRFGVHASKAQAITHVRIEDMSDDAAVLLVDDSAPVMKDGIWVGQSAAFGADAPELLWITYLDDSFRVYRITITLAGGRQVVLHQAMTVPGFAKAVLRRILGVKT